MRRVVSLFLPHWSIDRLRRKSIKPPPDSDCAATPSPVLVTALPDHGRRVIAAVSAEARALGVAAGMTVTRARSLAGDLEVVDADPDADLIALRKLALWAASRYTPLVAPDPPDGLWLDITGCAALFDNERALIKDLHRRIAAFGLHVQIAVADTPGCAHAVARYVPAGRPVTIEPGEHRKALSLLPVAALRLEPGVVEAMRKLGFDRIEQLIAEPRAPLAKRFGKDLYRRLDQALGMTAEPIAPLFPEHLPRARRGMMEPIATPEAFVRVLHDLVGDVVDQLLRAGKGARRLDCYFHRVDGHVQAIRVGTAAPTREPAALAKLLTAKIETIEPGLGIETMILTVSLLEPMGARQRDGLLAARREPDLTGLVDALANRFGRRHLYRASPRESAMPERSIALTAPLGNARGLSWDEDLPRPSRMLSPPEPIDVTAMLPDHPPAMFIWRRKRFRVAQADGPERLHGEWWRDGGQEADQPFLVRDYYQVETATGGRYWLFRQGDGENPATGSMRWFIHGAFA